MTPKQEAAARQALHRLQAHTDTADLDAIAALNEALAEQQAAEPVSEEQVDKIITALEPLLDLKNQSWQLACDRLKEIIGSHPAPTQQQEPVAGLRCKIIENCKSCQHSVGRLSCSLAGRNFGSLERSSVPPEWCPLPLYTYSPASKPLTIPEGYKVVPVDRSYDMRAQAMLHFNTAHKAGADRDDCLEAAWQATLATDHGITGSKEGGAA